MVIRRTRTPRTEEVPVAPGSRLEQRLAARRASIAATGPSEPDPNNPTIVPMSQHVEPFSDVIARANYRMQSVRPGDYLHVSDLLSKCIRRRVLEARLRVAQPPRRLTLSDIMTFAQGDAIHDVLKQQATIARPAMVWGKWSCKCEFLKHEEPCTYSEIDQDEVCPHCGTKVDRYHEVSMVDHELMVVGNPDIILYIQRLKAFCPVELKSIAPDQFKDLTRPKPEHVLQIVWYWYLMHKLGYPVTDKVSIFYATKGWMFGSKQPYLEFVIDPSVELRRLDDMIEDARAYAAAIQSKKAPLPARTFCSSPGDKKAKDCGVCANCFEGAV